jgi:hypothetical protein
MPLKRTLRCITLLVYMSVDFPPLDGFLRDKSKPFGDLP